MIRTSSRGRLRLLATAAALAAVPILAMSSPGVASAATSPANGGWFRANGDTTDSDSNWGALTWDGTSTYGDGLNAQGFQFDGSNGLTSSDPTLGAFGTSDFTAQFDIDTTASSTEVMSHRGDAGGGNCGQFPLWQVNIDAAGDAHLFLQIGPIGDDGSSFSLNSAVPVNDGTWHTVSIHRDGLTIGMSVDGAHPSSGTLPSNFDLGSGGPLTFEVADGNACGASIPANAPFVGTLDNIYLGDQPLTDLAITEPTVPVVPAGGSGSVTLQLTNPSAATVPVVTYFLYQTDPALTITGVSGVPGCRFTPSSVSCNNPVPALAAGKTALTIAFTVAGGAAPGSTLRTDQALTNQSVPDPNHYNDQLDTPMLVQVAPVNGSPMANWPIAGGGVGLLLVALLGYRRFRRPATGRP